MAPQGVSVAAFWMNRIGGKPDQGEYEMTAQSTMSAARLPRHFSGQRTARNRVSSCLGLTCRGAFAWFLLIALSAFCPQPVQAQTYQDLYNFGGAASGC